MNRWLFVATSTTCTVLLAGGCAVDDVKQDPTTAGTGGGGGTTGGAAPTGGSGGTTGGAAPTGGSGGTAGSGVATGGAGVSSGGTAGVGAGGASSGGTAAGVGPTGGTAGTSAGSSGTGPAGGTPPVGGMGGAAGTQAGSSSGGQGGMSEDLSPNAIVPGLDGFLWVGTCASASTSLDCAINNDSNVCPGTSTATPYAQRGAFRRRTFNVMGTQGRNYRLNFEVRGVIGGKNYMGGTRGPMATTFNEAAGVLNDGWYIGGTPTDSLWNTYEVHVSPAVQGQASVYYANGFPAGTGDGWHATVLVKTTTSFVVPGRGTIELVIHDSNCQGQQNCGPTGDTRSVCVQGPGPRTADLSGMDPQPMNFTQPYAQSNGLHPQWLLWDIKTIAIE